MRPLLIELFAGLHGWGEPAVELGWRVVAFDIVDMRRALGMPPVAGIDLVLQDVATIHGSQFRDADLIVASPPCPEFSYMAMPFSRGKQIAAALRGQSEFPKDYTGSRTISDLTSLFHACFRIQREACEAAGRHIPLIVENVRGAQPWVGRAKWHFGSYFLWGDVPALMPISRIVNVPGNDTFKKTGDVCGKFTDPRYPSGGMKGTGAKFCDSGFNVANAQRLREVNNGLKQTGLSGPAWFDKWMASHSSRSDSRKAASALIARIPEELARHIARVFYPRPEVNAA